jgi:hypothetical protein
MKDKTGYTYEENGRLYARLTYTDETGRLCLLQNRGLWLTSELRLVHSGSRGASVRR